MSTAVDLLSELPLFHSLKHDELHALASILEECQFKKDEFVFQYGEPGESLYIVRSGEAEVFIEDNTGNRMVLDIVSPGKYFGELSVLDGGPRTASVIVTRSEEIL
jgi:CRP/FNR family transcriptional regulator, cyclic AMP receptor protein